MLRAKIKLPLHLWSIIEMLLARDPALAKSSAVEMKDRLHCFLRSFNTPAFYVNINGSIVQCIHYIETVKNDISMIASLIAIKIK